MDIYGHVTCMRAQRNYMVQTEDQYVFIHEALSEAATCGNTEVPARNLYGHIQKLTLIPPGETATTIELEFKVGFTCAWFQAKVTEHHLIIFKRSSGDVGVCLCVLEKRAKKQM